MGQFIANFILFCLSVYRLIITPALNSDYLLSILLISYLIQECYNESNRQISNLHLFYYHTKLKDLLLLSIVFYMGQIRLIIILIRI